ncbi:CHAP domain-containing protein [Actinomadura sp. CNU-125]|uniref:CHAP domain-containing protein n=1 Tax=Actinomadura sp. CNU-125 TaxID=1904961 RepID=UPI0021CC930A|nr:CHAP domain-containing protein [Actinomadura sp. CNU-125]
MDPIGEKLLEVAREELGYTEKDDGYTKFGDWWTEKIDDDHNPYFTTAPWCDMFLAWAADKAGVTDQAGQFAATPDHAKWFEEHDAWGDEPEPGAIVFYDWNGSDDLDQIDHVGIVEKVEGETLHTIEANADGYKLMRKTRDMDHVVGFGYPGKVQVAQKYTPKHAAPAPKVDQLANPRAATGSHEQDHGSSGGQQLPVQEVALGGVLALVLCGTAALAVAARPPPRPRPRRPSASASAAGTTGRPRPSCPPHSRPTSPPPTWTPPRPAPRSCPRCRSPPPTRPRTASSGAGSPTSKRTASWRSGTRCTPRAPTPPRTSTQPL